MNKWGVRFWADHGSRLIFGAIATAFGVAFYFMPDMQGEAKTILIGVAMLAYNKARSEPGAKANTPTPGPE